MSKQSRIQNKLSRSTSGVQLVANFQSALVNRSTMQTANYHAKLSEQRAVDYISNSAINSNSVFINPHDIPDNLQNSVSKASLDAHMKKVQAQQISSKTIAQIQSMEYADNQKYRNKKIIVSILEPKQHPVKSFWQNNKTGKVTTGNITKKSIKGIIQDIDFNKNMLVLKPTRLSRTINPDRKLYAVYVVNPETFQPMISITISS